MSVLNKAVVTALPIIPKSIIGQVAKRYIAGETLAEGVATVQHLNSKTILATMDLLGEDVNDAQETIAVQQGIFSMLQAIKNNRLAANVSLKPTQLGLVIDKELAYRNIKTILEQAQKYDTFVRIDMEDATTTDATLDLYRRLHREGFNNTGVVIQACLRRSEADVLALIKEGANIRLCKGIYNELPSIAFKDRGEIRDNYLKLLKLILESGSYIGIATHDNVLIDAAYTLISELNLKPEQYEFQMLLGVREKRRDKTVSDGHHLRVYVPFGNDWYGYSTRRLKENPHMAWYITKAIFIHS
ncbi:MAG TPA: proline dehydrogenase family protein [Bacteroidota bacterium]|nr:proline dehydrogenase family protein [Bacteroidota bacterium]